MDRNPASYLFSLRNTDTFKALLRQFFFFFFLATLTHNVLIKIHKKKKSTKNNKKFFQLLSWEMQKQNFWRTTCNWEIFCFTFQH